MFNFVVVPLRKCVFYLPHQQLFGRIERIVVRDGFLVTGHFGKAFDGGCVSVRKICVRRVRDEEGNSLASVEIPVVFAMSVGDLLPVADLDFNHK